MTIHPAINFLTPKGWAPSSYALDSIGIVKLYLSEGIQASERC